MAPNASTPSPKYQRTPSPKYQRTPSPKYTSPRSGWQPRTPSPHSFESTRKVFIEDLQRILNRRRDVAAMVITAAMRKRKNAKNARLRRDAAKITVVDMLTARRRAEAAEAAEAAAHAKKLIARKKNARPVARAATSAAYGIAEERAQMLAMVRAESAAAAAKIMADSRAKNAAAKLRANEQRYGSPSVQHVQRRGSVTPRTPPTDPAKQTQASRREQGRLVQAGRTEFALRQAQRVSETPRVFVARPPTYTQQRQTQKNARQRRANAAGGNMSMAGRKTMW